MIPVKPQISQRAHIASLADYARLYQRSLDDPEGFWREQASILTWYHPPQQQDATGEHQYDRRGAQPGVAAGDLPWRGGRVCWRFDHVGCATPVRSRSSETNRPAPGEGAGRMVANAAV